MEEWKSISGNSNYIVSNTGRVRRKGSSRDHSVRDNKGYLTVDLYDHGKRKTERVHRLVAKEFIPNEDEKPLINHIDGNKHNNNISNLEWVTSVENVHHSWESGLSRPSYGMLGKSNPNAGRKGKPFKIVETGDVFDTLKDCEDTTDLSGKHINDCLCGRQKTHKGYHFEYV